MEWIKNKIFWNYALIAMGLSGLVFAWELGLLSFLPSPPRAEPTQAEKLFTIAVLILIGLNAGLFGLQKKNGSCPIGAKRAAGIGGTIGAVALLCPACILLPVSLFGLSLSLAMLGPFLPLLRTIAILILVVSAIMLRPKKH